MNAIQINPQIFREYDIRGIYGKDFDGRFAFALGRAYVKFLRAQKSSSPLRLAFAYDARPFSAVLHDYVMSGVQAEDKNIEVADMGIATTPMHFFALNQFKYDGGIMTTASHNPKEYGGFKLFQHNGAPISGRSGIKTIWRIIETMQDFDIAHHALHNEHFKSADYKEAYADFLFKNVGRLGRPCSVVVDAGNGTTGPVIETVARKLGLGLIPLFFEYDGTFPNRPPNPLEPMALSPLTDKVRKMHSDFGIALDGDGDRVVFVDSAGNVIESEKIFALLAKEALSRSPGRHVIIPINTSKMVSDTVARYGGQGILSPVGWTVITETMHAYNALVAGEVSGHYYFNEFFGGNSGILAALKVIKIFAQSRGQFSSLFSEFEGYCKSEEINIAVDHWPALASRLERVYAAARTMHRIDGLTFEFNNWWFNIRPSNTEPLVRLVVEAKNKEILEEKIAELRKHIQV